MPQFLNYTNLSQNFGGKKVLLFQGCLTRGQENRLSKIALAEIGTMKRCVKIANEQNVSSSTFGQMNILNWKYPESVQLKDTISQCLDRYIDEFSPEYRNGEIPRYTYGWANLVKRNLSLQRPHFHHSNPLNISAILYSVGEYGKNNGATRFWIEDKQNLTLIPKDVIPQPGMLLMYQATIPHNISFYRSDFPRLTYAFDILMNPEPKKMDFTML